MRVSLFASLYRQIGGPEIFKQIDARALIKSHDLYRELTEPAFAPIQPPLDITGAWVVAQGLSDHTAFLKDCASCQALYFESIDIKLPPTCPFCASRKERRRKSGGYSRSSNNASDIPRYRVDDRTLAPVTIPVEDFR
jgi:hypothetical protein